MEARLALIREGVKLHCAKRRRASAAGMTPVICINGRLRVRWHNGLSPSSLRAPMTQATDALVRHVLGDLIDPHTGAPLAENERAVGVDGARVSVDIQLGYPAVTAIDGLAARVRQALEANPAIELAAVSITSRIHVHKVQGKI